MDIVPPATDGAAPPKKRGRPRSARCGTPSGYKRHQRSDEKPCDACAAAKREYDKRWKSAPRRTQLSRINARAQMRSYQRLAHQFPDLYRTYYDEEKAAALAEADI